VKQAAPIVARSDSEVAVCRVKSEQFSARKPQQSISEHVKVPEDGVELGGARSLPSRETAQVLKQVEAYPQLDCIFTAGPTHEPQLCGQPFNETGCAGWVSATEGELTLGIMAEDHGIHWGLRARLQCDARMVPIVRGRHSICS